MTREMKNSGVEWIGDIPSEWKIIKSKYIFANHKEIVGDRENNFERLSLTLNGVLKRPKDDSKGLQSESLSTYQVLYKDELVFKMIDLENTSTSRVGYSPYTGLVSPVYIVFNNNKYSKYGFWYFYNLWQRNIYNTLGNNGVRSALNASDMLNLPFIQIPNEEQTRISDFLDSKVTEIDKIISETKASIENYKEYKQSVITEAVTKGLDKNVPMKDSGIEWIGKIPCEWKVCKIKNIFKIYSGATPKSEQSEYWNGNIIWITPADYKTTDKYISSGKRFLTQEGYDSCGTTLVPENSIIFSKRAPIGSVAISQVPLCTNQGCLACVCERNANAEFYYYVMSAFTTIFELYGSGTTFKEISFDSFSAFNIPFPSMLEQQRIVDFLNNKCAEIDNLISEKEKLIINLEEYKKSLIYEYVTGKKAVE